MANQRLLIWMTLAVMVWLTYRQWLVDYPPAPATEVNDILDLMRRSN